MAISVKLETFEGPLDLLLHLIDKNKLNIYDIPIVEITNQYMEYIREMNRENLGIKTNNKNLDIMSEFLVMAATLLNIKSKMLLPSTVVNEETAQDPRQELVNRLLEYKMYKFISLELKDKQVDAGKVLFKKSSLPNEISNYKEEVDTAALLTGLTLSQLHKIFQMVIKKQENKIDPIRSQFGRIEREEINLSKKIEDIQQYGLRMKSFRFRQLLELQSDKMEVIVTFLGILELMKLGRLEICQQELFDDFTIQYLAEDIMQADELSLE